jgi:malate dehydrogenase (quinone)
MDAWKPSLVDMIPSYGTQLSDDPNRATETLASTAKALGIHP